MKEMVEYRDGENRTTNHSINRKGKERESRRPKYKVLTPLITSRVTLLEEAFNVKLITLPQGGCPEESTRPNTT
ncbi:hypothetical protein CR513_17280, partial [Mucuna pruriens]